MLIKLSSLLATAAIVAFGSQSFAESTTTKKSEAVGKEKVVNLEIVEGKGFEPDEIKLASGQPVELQVTRKTDKTCAKKLTIPDLGVEQALAEKGKTYTVAFTPTKEGKLKFGCGMNQMASGWFIVE